MVYPSHHTGCRNSSVGTPVPPSAEARAPATKRQQQHQAADWRRITARRHEKNEEGNNKKSPRSPLGYGNHPARRGRLTLPVAVAVLALALAKPLGALAQEGDAAADAEDAEGGSSSSNPWELVYQLVLVAVLVAASGLFSGLTLGLLGLDKIGLEIISHGDEPQMAAFAKVGWRDLCAYLTIYLVGPLLIIT